MNTSLKRILEQLGSEGQYYDFTIDFSKFKHELDGSFEQLKQRFQAAIGEKLNGKRILAKASRGYKQYEKNYEFDVARISIDNYYDNYVVVAQDTSTGKPKEYFLKPGHKVKILGPATGQASPQKGGDPRLQKPQPTPVQSNLPHPKTGYHSLSTGKPMEEENKVNDMPVTTDKEYSAYSIDNITDDIKSWIPQLLKKPNTPVSDFIKKIGWSKEGESGVITSVFELKLPESMLKYKMNQQALQGVIFIKNPTLHLVQMEFDKESDNWNLTIKKIYRK